MKALFQKYKTVIRFVVLFLGSYVLLSICYAVYLQLSKGGAFTPDFITNLVAKQSSAIIGGFGYEALVQPSITEPIMELYVNGKYLARIIEGCNSLSIIILFMAFVIAFAEKFKKTLLFLFGGAVLIYAVNIVRIVILAVSLYHFPEHKEILHGVVFPGLIYGMVFLLWMLWVRMLTPKVRR
ncbi:exosortase family protein XrtF [Ulvibacter sp. MAR_2010_11]|uniref:exosortase family protein XrtF n=1 Tax=Ulvibacter sp. MAR_2010_11 TaxID=1250229 RepID=UPI000C2CC1FA|nr:exosortase family protein XrtF [Ulvibacter sp. MAR_2010_11]PKA82494.1 exosortase family protein XrtF [Ulvibacter sp. MAR_2010_11]